MISFIRNFSSLQFICIFLFFLCLRILSSPLITSITSFQQQNEEIQFAHQISRSRRWVCDTCADRTVHATTTQKRNLVQAALALDLFSRSVAARQPGHDQVVQLQSRQCAGVHVPSADWRWQVCWISVFSDPNFFDPKVVILVGYHWCLFASAWL